MKLYEKPIINLSDISLDKDIASAGLSTWLDGNNLNDAGATITTFSYAVVS